MNKPLSPSAQRVQDALISAGFNHRVIEHDQTTRSAQDAANTIGCTVGQIAKSLIFQGKNSLSAILVIASGSNRVNESRLCEAAGEPIQKANADFVLQETGFAIGGVPPVGHSRPIKTFIDEDFFQYAQIWAAAGTPNAVFQLTPQELEKMTGGKVLGIK